MYSACWSKLEEKASNQCLNWWKTMNTPNSWADIIVVFTTCIQAMVEGGNARVIQLLFWYESVWIWRRTKTVRKFNFSFILVLCICYESCCEYIEYISNYFRWWSGWTTGILENVREKVRSCSFSQIYYNKYCSDAVSYCD
jgi:hypothetical protein